MKKTDGRKNNGGARPGSGRPKKVDEAKSMEVLSRAILDITGEEDEMNAKVEFLKQWVKVSPRDAMKFINEHVIGKPKERQDIEMSTNERVIPVISFKSKSDG